MLISRGRNPSAGEVISQLFSNDELRGRVFTTLGLYGHLQKGDFVKYQVSPTIYKSIVRTSKQSECFGKDRIHEIKDWYCIIGKKKIKPSIVYWGFALFFIEAH